MVSISKLGLLLSLFLTTLYHFQLKGCEGGVVASKVEDSLFPPSKVNVVIYNSMAKKDLTIHCRDKHHDLGNQILSYGERFDFSFKPNKFMFVTLYFCRFTWVGVSHHFDIYDEYRDYCDECVWYILDTGPCNIYPRFTKCYMWNNQKVPL